MALVRRMITFDVPEGPIGPDDAAEGLARLRRIEGVQGAALYETRDGSPAYLLDIQLERAAADAVEQELNRQLGSNAQYLTNVTRRTFSSLA